MKHVITITSIGLCALVVLFIAQAVSAQGEGFLTPLTTDGSSPTNDLPAGAVYQAGQILHRVSAKENLHLLAAYYYGDPRQWRRIYRDNRGTLYNPNILSVGQTLQISVDQSWKPAFSYREWFRLATRNGEWSSSRRWERAPGIATQTPAVSAITPIPPRAQESTPIVQEAPVTMVPGVQEPMPVAQEPTPSAPQMTPQEVVVPPQATEVPAKVVPVIEKPSQDEHAPVVEATPSAQEILEKEKSAAEERAPAF